jgi:hypothetical protein
MKLRLMVRTMPVMNIRHKTTPYAALNIAICRQFDCSGRSLGNYDGGMNFLGSLGEVNNHDLHKKTATLSCTWNGKVSAPLPYEACSERQPNLLCDYNGSGNHFTNNDPRYLLPLGSHGLILNSIDWEDEAEMLEAWLNLKNYKWFRNWRYGQARKAIRHLNAECAKGAVKLQVC